MLVYLKDVADRYHGITEALLSASSASDSLLHVHTGLAIMLLARLISRRSLATWVPFVAVLAAESGNEVLDAIHFGACRWDDSLHDAANTLFWPAAIMIALRLRRARA